jgi:hypothetical protein
LTRDARDSRGGRVTLTPSWSTLRRLLNSPRLSCWPVQALSRDPVPADADPWQYFRYELPAIVAKVMNGRSLEPGYMARSWSPSRRRRGGNRPIAKVRAPQCCSECLRCPERPPRECLGRPESTSRVRRGCAPSVSRTPRECPESTNEG